MDIIKELRDGARISALIKAIERFSDTPVNIMEICGGQTHIIMKYGLPQILPENIEFIHGPGCPVCVMPKERIDHAISLANQDNVILVTLGDMMRVPGSKSALIKERASGRDVRTVYSPIDVLKIAKENSGKRVIYFAIGFETTTPMTAALMEVSIKESFKNIFFHINHVLVPPPIHTIMQSGDVKIDAFIAPGHVSVITGTGIYKPIVEMYKTPVVVTGFEPVDILEAVLMILRQFHDKRSEVETQYRRAVRAEGNTKAQQLIDKYLAVRDTFRWRGLGDIPKSGLMIRDEFAFMDAEKVYKDILPDKSIDDHKVCRCGDILRGKAKPLNCSVFGTACTPENPLGACMVSSEGSCHAYFKYKKAVDI
ncbi:MAG: hydrogenase formation protein HypD [Thermodesulfovibrionales bacterium]|nr:hydrogenase formation protein HypD [Thermodesulfovibrionales bacterium]